MEKKTYFIYVNGYIGRGINGMDEITLEAELTKSELQEILNTAHYFKVKAVNRGFDKYVKSKHHGLKEHIIFKNHVSMITEKI